MPLRDDAPGKIAEKGETSWYEKFIAVVLLLILVALYVDFKQSQRSIEQNDKLLQVQAQGVIRGYINRAATCDLAKSIGSDEPQHCDDEVIQPYRDKNIIPGSTASAKASRHTLDVLCAILQQTTMPTSVKNICLSS